MLATTTSQNAAFSLKKAYIKYLLPYECKFERGGIDPQTVLNAVDTKKDRNTRSAPSPANSSSNSNEAAHMRPFPDYSMGPSGPHPNHPSHMNAPGPRPGYPDPNMPPHQVGRTLVYAYIFFFTSCVETSSCISPRHFHMFTFQ